MHQLHNLSYHYQNYLAPHVTKVNHSILCLVISWALGVVVSGSFDVPLSLKIAMSAGMSLADTISVGGTEPARNLFSLYGSLELVDASV